MIKAMVLLRRPEAWTRERFHRWWLDEHVPYVTKLPDLPWDGIAELWFESRATLEAAWSSEVGQTALTHSRASHSDRLVLLTEEHVLLG